MSRYVENNYDDLKWPKRIGLKESLKIKLQIKLWTFLCNIQDIQIKIKIAYILLWK